MTKYGRLYDRIDFKDKNTVKSLLYFRSYFEKTDFTSDGTMFNKIKITHSMYNDLIDIYIDLDNLIEDCHFNNKNKRLLKLVESGYTLSYIYENFENYNESATKMMFSRMLDKITEKQREKEENECEDCST